MKTIQTRVSCRTYKQEMIPQSSISTLQTYFNDAVFPPFGTTIQLGLAAAEENDQTTLRGLGTYGFIKNPAGLIIGAVKDSPNAMVDFGFVMEYLVLQATSLGLGTCWLGGTFTKSAFSKRINKNEDEIIPAVIACGIPAKERVTSKIIRSQIQADRRLPWEKLFFENSMGNPLTPDTAGPYKNPLEMVRIGPSASNKQPWRIIKVGPKWHFICQRTPGYGKTNRLMNLVRLADMQRIDLGIALVHFSLTANELGLSGTWIYQDPHLTNEFPSCEYIITWVEA